MSTRRPFVVAAIGAALCVASFFGVGLYLFWDSPKLINFLSAWIPFVLSVLFAFVPSGKEIKHEWIKWCWRGGVITVGLLWSAVIWHQQDLSNATNTTQTAAAVKEAVNQANTHSDEKFKEMQGKVTDLGKSLNGQLSQTESDLGSKIGNVGTPEPPERPKLRFSLWKEDLRPDEFPIESITVHPDEDGNLPVSFIVRNDSGVQAEGVEIWVFVCDVCSFAKEPTGFERPEGLTNQARHRSIPAINPGVSIRENNTISIKINRPGIVHTQIQFKSTCKTCGPPETSKVFSIDIEPGLTLQR